MSTVAPLRTQAAKPQPTSNASHAGLLLQRKCACGASTGSLTGECAECASKKRLQTKLTIGASNDPLEQEADRVADQVMAAPVHSTVRGVPLHIQRLTAQPSTAVGVAPASVDRVLASPGRPLEPALRQDMEQRFGHDFSRVRVHTGGDAEQSARNVSANAYTVGHDIVFGGGRFILTSNEGRRLIAHELTHVVQQSDSDESRASQSGEKLGLTPINATTAATPKLRAKPDKSASAKQDKPKVPQKCGRPSRKVPGNSITKVTIDVGANTLEIEWQDKTKIPPGGAGTHAISPGAGLCCVDCNDDTVSQTSGKLCTPKGGAWQVDYVDCALSGHPKAKNPTYFQRDGIAIHSGNTSNPPQSHGCSRTSLEISELIHDNVVPKQTVIASSGTWAGRKCYLTQDAEHLSNRREVCQGNQLKPKGGGMKGKEKKSPNAGFDVLDDLDTGRAPSVRASKPLQEENNMPVTGDGLVLDFENPPEMAVDGPGPHNEPTAHESIGDVPGDGSGGGENIDPADALQKKLAIGASNDPLEEQADRMADQVLAAPEGYVVSGIPQRIQPFTGQPSAEASEAPASVGRALGRPGRPLEPALREDMELRLGHDFSNVQLHADSDGDQSARDVGALAYTVGNHIVFRRDQLSPTTAAGRRLVAHELSHVIQQGEARPILRRTSEDLTDGEGPKPVPSPTRTVAPLLQRFLSNEPAGGCGVCYGTPANAGKAAHALIQMEFETLYPLGLVELGMRSVDDDNGRLDLAVAVPGGLEIGEIKPANAQGYEDGILQIGKYLGMISDRYPGTIVKPLTKVLPPAIFPTLSSGCPVQALLVNPPVGGVYGYYCLPSFAELKKKGCGCRPPRRRQQEQEEGAKEPKKEEKKEQAKPTQQQPEMAAKPSRTQLVLNFVRTLVESKVADYDAAANEFLSKNPEVASFIIVSGIAVIAALIADDIIGGFADDVAIPPILAALWRAAQALR